MALQHVRAAQAAPIADNFTKIVLCTIATDIGRHGSPCWPSLRNLAQRCNASPQTIANTVKSLAEHGWITIGKRGQSNLYALTPKLMNMTHECDAPEIDVERRVEILEREIHELKAMVNLLLSLSKQPSKPSNQPSKPSNRPSKPSNQPSKPSSTSLESLYRSNRSSLEVIEEEEKGNSPPLSSPNFSLKIGMIEDYWREFSGHDLEKIWPLVSAFQDSCNHPRLEKFMRDVWDAYGTDGLTAADIRRIAPKVRRTDSQRMCWPRNVINLWHAEQMQPSPPSSPQPTHSDLVTVI